MENQPTDVSGQRSNKTAGSNNGAALRICSFAIAFCTFLLATWLAINNESDGLLPDLGFFLAKLVGLAGNLIVLLLNLLHLTLYSTFDGYRAIIAFQLALTSLLLFALRSSF